MSARQCLGTNSRGGPCGRAPSKGEDFCLAHSPTRREEHVEASRAGGIAVHDPAAKEARAEILDVKRALWNGTLTPGAGSVLLQAIRLGRDVEAEDRHAESRDFVASVQ